MNYRHAFHAGNFADVHKHVVLMLLLEHLRKKPKPFFVLDTHAGRGRYDLHTEQAARGGEWQCGIDRVRAATKPAPVLNRYLELVGSTGNRYPGSPLIVAKMLRDNDRAVCVEKHLDEARALAGALAAYKRVLGIHGDGYAALTAHLPPKENRGLVLMDPPYEADSEFADLSQAFESAYRRWSNGMYCLWYPIKAARGERSLHRAIRQSGIKKILVSELGVRPLDSPIGLNGSGLMIVNPPWQLDAHLQELLPELRSLLAQDGAGTTRVEWLVGE